MNELNKIYMECLSKFPELKNSAPKLLIEKTSDILSGAKGKKNNKTVIALWIPEQIWGKWDIIKPIIYHELSHCINLKNPDKIFYERADEKSKLLWKKLTEQNTIECKS